MSAIKFDFELDEGRDNSLDLTWYNENAERVDLTDYTAIAEVRTSDGDLVSRVSTGSGITLQTPDPGDAEAFAATGGQINVTFPAEDLQKPKDYKCKWELVMITGTSRPFALVKGKAPISRKIAEVDE